MLFNEKMKKIRKESNLTQEELSEKLNVSRQAITKWETGEGIPDIENLKQISNLFNISIDELVKEDLDANVNVKKRFNFIKEIEIDHTKHFDINISKIYELNIKQNKDEKVKVELTSNEEIEDVYKIIFDDKYDNLDIDIKSKKMIEDLTINILLPEKYINDIELNSKIKTLNISSLDLKKIEYDGDLKYLNVNNTKGMIVLNTSRSDVEVDFDKLDGSLEVNLINSVARVTLPKNTEYKTILNGKKNEFIDASDTQDAKYTIELNGLNSKLIIIEK